MKQTSILDETATDVYTVLPNVKKGVPDDRKANIELYNEDNMTLMARYPDNYFDLAIVDPPYGIGERMYNGGNRNKNHIKFRDALKENNWDKETPNDAYFKELFRVSKNQIIWGGNYFDLPPTRCFICWDKMVYVPTMSQVEYAWTSFDSPARLTKINNTDPKRIHPTQKPIKLYGWLINHYCKKGFKVLDTHLGSGSIAIACHKYGIDLVACEIDKDYFEKAKKRLETEQAQQSLF